MKLVRQSIRQIWNKSSMHCAFTDLIYFEKKWYCAFREGSHHMSFDGKIRVLMSDDGVKWKAHSLIPWSGGDLRDPKFFITPEGKLFFTAGVRVAARPNLSNRVFSVTFELERGRFSQYHISKDNALTWRWSASTQNNSVYSVAYSGLDGVGCLYKSIDGKNWIKHVTNFYPQSPCFTNETSIAFKRSGLAFCLTRRDGSNCNALLGTSKAPYKKWNWIDLNIAVGGPKLLFLNNNTMIAAFRVFTEDDAKTMVYQFSELGEVKHLYTLPSSGDCSYPGLVEVNGQLWVSYYSSHNSNTSIYLAKFSISA